MDHGGRAVIVAAANGPEGGLPAEGAAADHRPPLDDQGPVVEHERDLAPEVLRHAPRGGIAPARDQDQTHARRPRPRNRRPRAGRQALLAREQGSVDVEGEEPEANSPQRPPQISILSITSPGRIRSTTSIPLTTCPKRV